jgi:hypothetical protein
MTSLIPLSGHWRWGPDDVLATMGSAGGFLPRRGVNFHDFAGSMVVHDHEQFRPPHGQHLEWAYLAQMADRGPALFSPPLLS